MATSAEADRWHFGRPELARRYLDSFKLGLSSAHGLFARRRMGKTEFLSKDLLPAAQAQDYLTAYVNLWDNRSAPEQAVIAALGQAVEPTGFRKLLKGLVAPVSKIKASAGVPGVAEGALEAEFTRPGAAGESLRLLLRALDRKARTLILVIDEAQVLARAAHSDFAHALRAGLDVRKQSIKVVFAGSSETTLRAMFASPTAPFYNWAPLEPFPLLGEEFVAYLVGEINKLTKYQMSVSEGMIVFERLHRTPEFFRRFLGHYILNPGKLEETIAQTEGTVFSNEQFVKQWKQLSSIDREVLRLIAQGKSDLHTEKTLKQLTEVVRKQVTKTSVSHALRRLQESNTVTRLSLGEYHVEDEAFAEFVRRLPDA